MAKTPAKNEAPPAPPPPPANAMSPVTVAGIIELEMPVNARAGRAGGEGKTYPFGELVAGSNRPYFEPVTIPATITDEAEREKAFKEAAKKATNRLSGAMRRHKKANPSYAYAMRTINTATHQGVAVYRLADLPPAPPAPVPPVS